jgi:purine-binding chemotaxis protein CheW
MLDDDTVDRRTAEAEEDETSSTWLTLELGEQVLGIGVRHVREILDIGRITPLPNAAPDTLGVVDVRGTSVPILDIKPRLGVASRPLGDDARIVVIRMEPGTAAFGILADRVRNVDRIPPAEIEPVPDPGGRTAPPSGLTGLCRQGQDLVVLLDLERFFGETGGMALS